MSADLILVDGRPATPVDLGHPALVNFGHFTAMQVRRGRVRGLEQHLNRLTAATRELFERDLDPDLVRSHLRRVLDGAPNASVRVNVHQPEPDGSVVVMVARRPPFEESGRPWRLRSVTYQRPVPHLKHVGTFAQTYHGREARRLGYDDALLADIDGTVSETAIANLGFFVDGAVHWPDAPCLIGTTMALLGGFRRLLRLVDVPGLAGAFVANANGIAPVDRVDDTPLPIDERLMAPVLERYRSVPWDVI